MMKLLPALLLCTAFNAMSAEVIEPKYKSIRSMEWYEHQSSEWGKLSTEAPGDAFGWLNFYMASRYANQMDKLPNITQAARQQVGDQYETALIAAWQAGYDPAAYRRLIQLQQLHEDRSESLGLLAIQSMYFGDHESQVSFEKQLMERGLISTSLLNYSYNVLMSLEPASVLFTEGDHTTLPLFILQDLLHVRPDVTIASLDMLTQQEFLRRFIAEHQVTWHGEISDKPTLCAVLPKLNPQLKFYFALTLDKQNTSALQDNLYVTGLASEFSEKRFDNLAELKANFEQRFLLDYLTVDFSGEDQFGAGKAFHTNYLVPFLLLSEHYANNNESQKATALKELSIHLATEAGKLSWVNNYLSKGQILKEKQFIPYALDLKDLEGHLRKVKDNVYAWESETTNSQYNVFLSYLQTNNLTEDYEKYKFDLSAYEEPAYSMMRNYTLPREVTKKDKYFTNYPAVNVPYEGALAYCAWLTEQYNHTEDRKYKEVIFRLPDLNEWQVAAAGIPNATSWVLNENQAEVRISPPGQEPVGKNFTKKMVSLNDPEILYPWFKFFNYRSTPLNSKGCYLGNFKVPEDQTPCVPKKMNTADGFMAMAPVESYFPNDIGLYDVVGNVAEMINEPGKACGGSWNHTPQASTIRSINSYSGPDAAIGFRIFMEVIQP